MSVLMLGVLAWAAGIVAYIASIAIIYHQWISSGDFWFVVGATGVVFGLCYVLIYLPVLKALRRVLPRPQPPGVFVLAAILIGLIPIVIIARFWGGSLNALMTPESMMFALMFSAVGLVIGLGFPRLDTKD